MADKLFFHFKPFFAVAAPSPGSPCCCVWCLTLQVVPAPLPPCPWMSWWSCMSGWASLEGPLLLVLSGLQLSAPVLLVPALSYLLSLVACISVLMHGTILWWYSLIVQYLQTWEHAPASEATSSRHPLWILHYIKSMTSKLNVAGENASGFSAVLGTRHSLVVFLNWVP